MVSFGKKAMSEMRIPGAGCVMSDCQLIKSITDELLAIQWVLRGGRIDIADMALALLIAKLGWKP